MARLFGTDGVRGIANIELTPELAFKLGRYGAMVLTGETAHKPTILVGNDTRISCAMLESALVAGICSAGANAMVCGVIPTPGIAKLVKVYKCDAGVVISASHNSFEFNGIKFFDGEGYKLPDRIEDKIEEMIRQETSDGGHAPHGENNRNRPHGENIGHRYFCVNASKDYIHTLKHAVKLDLTGVKIAVDCANGAVAHIAVDLLKDYSASVVAIGIEPDGLNINKDCGSTHLKSLCELVVKEHCDIGLAFDGDADRMLAVDSNGRVVDGDVIMAVLALDMKQKNILKDNTLVVTVMSNLGLDIFARENGINLSKTSVGDRYVLEEMVKHGYILGGEQSGHVILLENSTTGDGLLSALRLLQTMQDSGKSLVELSSVVRVLPQVLKGAKVKNEFKSVVVDDPELQTACKEMEDRLDGKGRILIRASGTEPLIRVMLEGEDLEQISEMCQALIDMINRKFGIAQN